MDAPGLPSFQFVTAGREDCNYDLKIIEFLKSLDSAGTQKDYEALRASPSANCWRPAYPALIVFLPSFVYPVESQVDRGIGKATNSRPLRAGAGPSAARIRAVSGPNPVRLRTKLGPARKVAHGCAQLNGTGT
jgi:hypothetical protein